ncbi:receptor-like protein 56 [Neltuma alba]|uniref:receptor-like protein 56 n=1 Tax=Neltuma alba TaxID=207710 RepID=UPI0010A51499|nr:receptor-like protein 56 [Prosopis alba]
MVYVAGGLCNLKNLSLLDLGYNEFEGQLPACLGNLTSLRALYLSQNRFEGTFPSSLFHTLRFLTTIFLTDDNFSGSFSLSSLANLKILTISCSNTNLRLETENPPFIPSFQLRSFTIRNCTLNEASNKTMPTFLLHQYDLVVLELSHLNISGTFPSWLLTNNTKLNYFSLSQNLFIGPFELNSTSKLLQMESFDICSNPIGDEIPSHIGFIFPNLISIDMSSTLLRGSFPASIGEMRQLNDLDLSDNNLSVYLPQEFGQGNNELRFLKLTNNHLSGPCLPIGSNFTSLLFLDLNNNNFKGKLEGGVMNCTKLRMLDIGANQLSSELPNWIGNLQHLSYLILSKNSLTGQVSRLNGSFLSLSVLMLKGNKLEGSIPTRLCELKNIRLLDLSQNKLSGGIPYCLNNITFGKIDAPRKTEIGHFVVSWTTRKLWMDLSSNELTDEIPFQIGYLGNIHALNLSNNQLKGPIPETFSNLKQIESLDLSHNKLIGHIPEQLIQLYSLCVFSVAHNNLSGTTPDMKNQFATFDSASYEGNPFLCGPPLQQNCSKARRNKQSHHSEGDEFQDAFLWSFAGAFGSAMEERSVNPFLRRQARAVQLARRRVQLRVRVSLRYFLLSAAVELAATSKKMTMMMVLNGDGKGDDEGWMSLPLHAVELVQPSSCVALFRFLSSAAPRSVSFGVFVCLSFRSAA